MFTLFRELPFELQLHIWDIAARSAPGRTIKIHCEKSNYRSSGPRQVAFHSSTALPPNLYACADSRREGLKIYDRYFVTDSNPAGILIDFERDALCFADSVLQYLSDTDIESLENVILRSDRELTSMQVLTLRVKDFPYFAHFHMDKIIRMRKLRLLELVVQRGVEYGWSTGSYAEVLLDEWKEASEDHPTWSPPTLKIMDAETMQQVVLVEGQGSQIERFEVGTS